MSIARPSACCDSSCVPATTRKLNADELSATSSVVVGIEVVDEPHLPDRKAEHVEPAEQLERARCERRRDDELAARGAAIERDVIDAQVREVGEARAARIVAPGLARSCARGISVGDRERGSP